MSVDTNVKNKNLARYKRVLADGGLRVLVAPQLEGLASSIRVRTTGLRGRKLAVELGE